MQPRIAIAPLWHAALLACACAVDDAALGEGAHLGATASSDATSTTTAGSGDATSTDAEPPSRRTTTAADGGGDGSEGAHGTESGGGSGGALLDAPWFVDVTAQAGLAIDHGPVNEAPDCYVDNVVQPQLPGDFCTPERLMAGVAVADYDADGWPDVFLTSLEGIGHLMHNQGDGTFVDRTADAGFAPTATRSTGAAWADVDKDGDLDLYVATLADTQHYLFVNQGDATFVEEAQDRGAALDQPSSRVGTTPAFGDPDKDGDLDLYVGEWRSEKEQGDGPSHARYLRNLGPATPGWFVDATEEVGLGGLEAVAAEVDAKPGIYVFAPAFVDFDGDGWQDLALASDFRTSRLFWNAGDGTFVDGTVDAGVGTDNNGMGAAIGDVDQDGDLDWFVTAISHELVPHWGNRLYLYAGDREFVEAQDSYGVRDGGWGWGTALFDRDLDGDLDLVQSSAWTIGVWSDDPPRLWHNAGAPPWLETSWEAGLDAITQGRGLVTLDYDRDGDLDVLVANYASTPILWRNEHEGHGWLRVRAMGTASDTHGMGARVEVRTSDDAPPIVRVIGVGAQLYGHDELLAHFGLGEGTAPLFEVRVRFPGDAEVVLGDVERDQEIVVVEP